jgi:hypothetical protein
MLTKAIINQSSLVVAITLLLSCSNLKHSEIIPSCGGKSKRFFPPAS